MGTAIMEKESKIVETVAREEWPTYKKPLFEKQDGMTFTKEIIGKYFNAGRYCIQCSSCHGCQ